MIELSETLPGHWMSHAGLEMAKTYAKMKRSDLGKADMTDLELANAVFMASREDLDLIVWQTAAKQRIRWLSVQLAIAEARLSEALASPLSGGGKGSSRTNSGGTASPKSDSPSHSEGEDR